MGGMSFGLLIAFELIFPDLKGDLPWLIFKRLRQLHTNAVIFGFTLSGIFATWDVVMGYPIWNWTQEQQYE